MTRVPNEHYVQRMGNSTNGYGLGWYAAHRPTETGIFALTWREAFDWADADARRRLDAAHASRSQARKGLVIPRYTPAAENALDARLGACLFCNSRRLCPYHGTPARLTTHRHPKGA